MDERLRKDAGHQDLWKSLRVREQWLCACTETQRNRERDSGVAASLKQERKSGASKNQ